MDLSDTFFKMSEKAYRYFGIPDGAIIENLFGRFSDRRNEYVLDGHYKRAGNFPLYRQDQLQLMMAYHWRGFQAKFVHFNNCMSRDKNYYEQFNSFEQLWIAVVFKESFNRIWDGKDWIDDTL